MARNLGKAEAKEWTQPSQRYCGKPLIATTDKAG